MIAKLPLFCSFLLGAAIILFGVPARGLAQASEQELPASYRFLVLPADPFDARSPKTPTPMFKAPELTPWNNQPVNPETGESERPLFIKVGNELRFRDKPDARASEELDLQKVNLKDSLKIPLAGSVFLFGQAKKDETSTGPEPKF